jgi:beta-galactosidase
VYQTEKWDKPAKLLLSEIAGGVEVKLVDEKGVQCLDARNFVRFALAGDGVLIDNLGTSTTARKVQLYNGRAQINVQRKGRSVVSVSSEGLPTAFLNI